MATPHVQAATLRLIDDRHPAPAAPALAPTAVVFLDARHGFIATNGGGQYIPKVGWARPTEPGRIQETTDGGVSWRTVWSGRGIVLTSLVFDPGGRRATASGVRSPMTGGYGPTPTRSITVTSTDGGRTWGLGGRAVAPPNPLRGRAGRIVYDASAGEGVTRIRRSQDGDRTWRTVLARHGRQMWVPIARLGVVDARHVWAVSYENNQGFGFFDVHISDDGGRTWARRRVPALPSAFEPGGRAWAVDGATGAVWRTLDEGHTWRVSTAPTATSVATVDVAAPGEVDVETNLGELRSTDRGRSWTSVQRSSERASARRNGRLAFVPATAGYSEHALIWLNRGWTILHPPPRLFTFGDAWFVDSQHGLLAAGDASGADVRARTFRTSNGGKTWSRIRLPPGASADDMAALGPDTIVVEQPYRLLVSTDDGSHWDSLRVPLEYPECVVQRPRATTWIACGDVIGREQPIHTVLLRTLNGHAWELLTAPGQPMYSFHAISDSDGWTATRTGDPTIAAALWHTVDGGRTWRRVAIAPRPDADVVYRLPLPR